MRDRQRAKQRNWGALTATELNTKAYQYAMERVRASLSTEPVDESLGDDLLCQVYKAAQVAPPQHIHWLDGPLELLALLTHGNQSHGSSIDECYRERVPQCAWDDTQIDAEDLTRLRGEVSDVKASTDYAIHTLLEQAKVRIRKHLDAAKAHPAIAASAFLGAHVERGTWSLVALPLWEPVRDQVGELLWFSLGAAAHWAIRPWIWNSIWGPLERSLWHATRAYLEAPMLAEVGFFDDYFWPLPAGVLARFNEQVSGYWLGKSVAFVVRKPRVLAKDGQGRLHHASGPAVAYADGWEIWAWHGVIVPQKIILAPQALTRDDFVQESNVEVRRVIQERMGERFVPEVGGTFIDSSARGVLYEIALPNDPDEVARYLQVQDPSTRREYYLRVPPEIATAEEAAAWTFGLSVEDYKPIRES